MKQHIVTIIQGNGSVLTKALDEIPFYESHEYIVCVLEGLECTQPLVLPLTIHYTEVK